ncbi:S-methyl-5-thioribose-1-phosphate isomerase [Entomophthora muscae]|uniref:S-methyl-5-thioribose-1-phosphate isomerase n=1 Tax=Entomophthora muscae TaxID=34485 RepID=A0ACC2S0T9_9FUNG|nr:S-methyl-5-thioribose-1-phosphate isomerase [Entomophthora muscae]
MSTNTNNLQAIKYKRGELLILDQLLLPHQASYYTIETSQEGHNAIKTMKVRGAPAIAIVACLSLAVELSLVSHKFQTKESVLQFIHKSLEYLKTSRPTAVNLFEATDRLWEIVKQKGETSEDPKEITLAYLEAAESMLDADVQDNMNIGNFGAKWLLDYYKKDKLRILTHCNTGSLATAGYGTALGIIRSLHKQGVLEHAYCTETRPYNQGSRLTAYELSYENMSATLICDSMVTALLSKGLVDGIVVGADRVARNGDTANKIGTHQLAILANHFKIPFIVAAPTTSIDLKTLSGQDIPIEERSSQEVISVSGLLPGTSDLVTVTVGHPNINVWNPAFDVTPASFISAIVTERGAFVKETSKEVYDLSEVLKL